MFNEIIENIVAGRPFLVLESMLKEPSACHRLHS